MHGKIGREEREYMIFRRVSWGEEREGERESSEF